MTVRLKSTLWVFPDFVELIVDLGIEGVVGFFSEGGGEEVEDKFSAGFPPSFL